MASSVLGEYRSLTISRPPAPSAATQSHPVTQSPIQLCFFLMHLNLYCKQAVAACVNFFFFWFGCFSEKLCCSSYRNTSGSLETLTSQVSIPACQKDTCQRPLYQTIQNPCSQLCIRCCQIAQLDIQRCSQYTKLSA